MVAGACLLLTAGPAAAEDLYLASPGDPVQPSTIETSCPTFSWGLVTDAAQYELQVADLDSGVTLLQRSIAGVATAWTPSAAECLERDGEYAWSLRVSYGDGRVSDWSAPNLFAVSPAPTAAEFQAALAVVRDYLALHAATGSASTAGSPVTPPAKAVVAQPASAPPANPPALAAGGVFAVDALGNVEGIAFSGDGSGLTNLNMDPANLGAGTAAIDISGSAADVACSGCISESELAVNPATQNELDAHAADPGAHHEKTIVDAGNQLSYSGTTLNVEEGSGSGLDGDTLDGIDSALLALRSETVAADQSCALGWTVTGFDATGALICAPPCGDGVIDAPEECDDGNDDAGDGCDHFCRDEQKWVFVSSQSYAADFGGTAGADAICQGLAGSVGLPGSYRAWISAAGDSASDRFNHSSVPYLQLDAGVNTKIADDWADLTDINFLDAGINVDQTGALVASDVVWTGTNPNGSYDSSREQCGDWIQTTGFATSGQTGLENDWWTNLTAANCNGNHRLYCFQQ